MKHSTHAYLPLRLPALLKMSSATLLRSARLSSGLLLPLCASPYSSLATDRRSVAAKRASTPSGAVAFALARRTEPFERIRLLEASGLVEYSECDEADVIDRSCSLRCGVTPAGRELLGPRASADERYESEYKCIPNDDDMRDRSPGESLAASCAKSETPLVLAALENGRERGDDGRTVADDVDYRGCGC